MWLSGSLHAANWMLVGISACWMLPAALLLLFTARTADIALLGHQVATGLGVNSSRLALLRVAAPIILTTVCVSCVGNIGFVGLIAPHYLTDWWTIFFATALAAQEQFLTGVICVYFFLC